MDYSIRGEIVSFSTKDNLTLHGFFCRPKTRSDKAVLHIHGLEGSFYRNSFIHVLARKVTMSGFNFLSIELRGSYSVFELKKKHRGRVRRVLAGGSVEKFEECVYDIAGAIKYLRSIGMKKIFLQGHSTGCQKIVYYQSRKQDGRVNGMILLAPADDYNIWKRELGRNFSKVINFARRNYDKNPKAMMPERYPVGLKSLSRFLSLTDLRFVESRIFNYELKRLDIFSRLKIPILAIFGTKEEYAVKPVSTYLGILERDSNSSDFKAVLIRGANHGFREKEEQLARAVTAWLSSF